MLFALSIDHLLEARGRSTKDPILEKDSLAVASAPAEIVPETTVALPNGLTASSSNLLCL